MSTAPLWLPRLAFLGAWRPGGSECCSDLPAVPTRQRVGLCILVQPASLLFLQLNPICARPFLDPSGVVFRLPVFWCHCFSLLFPGSTCVQLLGMTKGHVSPTPAHRCCPTHVSSHEAEGTWSPCTQPQVWLCRPHLHCQGDRHFVPPTWDEAGLPVGRGVCPQMASRAMAPTFPVLCSAS